MDGGVVNGIGAEEDVNVGDSSGERFRLRMSAISASFLTKTCSVISWNGYHHFQQTKHHTHILVYLHKFDKY